MTIMMPIPVLSTGIALENAKRVAQRIGLFQEKLGRGNIGYLQIESSVVFAKRRS